MSDHFSEYAAWQMTEVLAPEIAHHAKRAVLDWFAALYPGTQIAPCTHLLSAHRDELGFGRSSLPGCGTTAFASTAAWITGSASHAIEFDDIFRDAVYHPGCPVIAAALAVGEHLQSDGLTFLKAVVVGYEVSTRIGAQIQPEHYRFFHTTGTVGCFGAAAATAALVSGGDRTAIRHAISNAASFAGGLQQAFRSDAMTKALHAGNAANVGVRMGLAASHGVTGAHAMLEGETGFGAALVGRPIDWAQAHSSLGQTYNIMAMTQKNHGCCGHTFAAIDAALALRPELQDVEQIESIEIFTYATAIEVTGNFHPKTAFECKFSLPYTVCHALLYGSVRLAAFSAQAQSCEMTRRLMSRVALTPDERLSATFPKQRAARVRIRLEGGRVVEHYCPYRIGDPEQPLSDTALDDKFLELVSPVTGDAFARRLQQDIWRLEHMTLSDLQLV